MSAVLIDKGCVVNSLYHYPTNMVFFTTPELLEIGDIPMTSLNEKPGRTEALKYYRRVAEHYKLDIRQYERVLGIEGEDGDFSRPRPARAEYRARKIVLATGYYDVPNLLNVPGEELHKVIHYYKEAHPYYNHDVLVVGAKNSAAIAALELWWTGARVTMVHRGQGISRPGQILDQAEHREPHQERRDPGVFQLVDRGNPPESRGAGNARGRITLKNDFVFAMTGYRPDLEFLESLGIRLDPETQRPYTNPETLESDRNGIFLAGVIVAGMHTNEIFIENGRFHDRDVARHDAEPLSLNDRHRRFEKSPRRHVVKRGVVIGKVTSEVAEIGRAQAARHRARGSRRPRRSDRSRPGRVGNVDESEPERA